jgi:phage tail sheath gpL-like
MSLAVSLADIARIVGYAVEGGNFAPQSPNLPQRVAVLAEMNTANQSQPLTPTQLISSKQAADLYGNGSPMHILARILFPENGGGGVNGIPVWAYPQLAAGSSVANSQSITVTGTATANATHTLLIAGRELLESGTYDINIVSGDTPTVIAGKIVSAITAVLGCPVSATNLAGVVTTVAKWTGLTSQGITISVLTKGVTAGVSYAIAEVAAGTGTPSISSALTSFGTAWNTLILNSYGLVSAVVTSLTNWNGNINQRTGQYAAIIMKPAIAITGSVLDTNTTSADTVVTDAQKAEMTIAIAPAPMSLGLPMEAAANAIVNFANISQDTPNIDIQGLPYPDMPLPAAGNIPATSSYTLRNALVKMGMSTALIVDGAYVVQDFITTYHPDAENPPQFKYARNLMADMNIKFQFYLLQTRVILNKQIANDNDNVTAKNVVKPKDVKAALVQFANSLVSQGLIVDAKFMISTISVVINSTNPDRFDISFSYKRSGVVRVVSTTVTPGFNFGQVA